MNASVALIGSGNAFFKDEGAGLYAAKYLKENYVFEPALEIVDGGTLGFGLMPLLQEFDVVVIANTSSRDDAPAGSIEVQSGEELIAQTGIKKTANEVEIAEMLQICSMASRVAETTIVSIVPEDILSVGIDMTSVLRAKWFDYIDAILGELEKRGVRSAPGASRMSLDEILGQFADPSVEHARGF